MRLYRRTPPTVIEELAQEAEAAQEAAAAAGTAASSADLAALGAPPGSGDPEHALSAATCPPIAVPDEAPTAAAKLEPADSAGVLEALAQQSAAEGQPAGGAVAPTSVVKLETPPQSPTASTDGAASRLPSCLTIVRHKCSL